MKKIVSTLLCFALCLTLGACSSETKKGSEEFAAYVEELPALMLEGMNFDVNFLFDHPENYGIERDVYTLDYMSLEDYKKYNEEVLAKLSALDEYDYEQLNEDQKIVYDLLSKQTEDNGIDEETMYYLTSNYFDVNSGIQAQLMMSLWNYEFKNQKSLDSFLAVLNDAPSTFKKYVELEQTRQEKGFGMSQTYMDDVLKAFHVINTTDQSYVLDSVYEKVDQLDFISAAEKETYKETVKKAFDEQFLPAFVQTEADLSAITITKEGEGELSSYTSGKEYYEDIVSEAAAVSTIEEYDKFLNQAESKITARLYKVVAAYPEINQYLMDSEKLSEAMKNLHYTDYQSVDEVIPYLENEVASGKDFPKIKDLDYQMNVVPPAMKDTFQASAAYFLSAFDDTSGNDEHMILNGEFKQDNFTTIAHESFPGHMYQHNYFKTVDHNILRDLLSSSTYSEGWATYIEDKACDYSEEPGLCHLNNINSQLTYLYILKLDKQIHYDGISKEEVLTSFAQDFGLEGEDAEDQYKQLLENPAIFTNYYVGYYRILDLKEQAEKSWGSEFNDYKFNETILNLGPLPMDLLAKYTGLEFS